MHSFKHWGLFVGYQLGATYNLRGLLTSFYDILRGFICVLLEVVDKELTELGDLILEVCSPGP